jgi:hypothetical protein
MSIAHMERLELVPLIIQDNAAVRQHTVDIKQEQLDLFRFGLYSGFRFSHLF